MEPKSYSLLRRIESRIRLCTHAMRQGRERDSRNAAWPGPTNGKEGRWRSWWKIYFAALVDITEGIENMAKTCVRLIILKRIDKAEVGDSGLIRPSWYKRQPTRVEVDDKVMLEVLSWKDVVHMEKKEMSQGHSRFLKYKSDVTIRFLRLRSLLTYESRYDTGSRVGREELRSRTTINLEEVDSCGEPNYLIGECPKPPKVKNQIAFIGGSWSDSGEDDEKVKNETCLVAQASSEIITKNKRLKAARNSLEKELSVLKENVSALEKNKGVDLECVKFHMLKIENEKLKDEALKLTKFENMTHCLNEMLSNQKPFGDKLGLGFNSFEVSSSRTKEIKFVKAQKKASSNGGPINMGGPLSMQAATKAIMGPPPATTLGSEKSVSFQKSILGPRLKHIIVSNVKVPVICLGVDLEPNEWIKDIGFSKHMMGNRKLFSSYKAYNGGQICDNKCRVTFSEHDSEITKDGKVIAWRFDSDDGLTEATGCFTTTDGAVSHILRAAWIPTGGEFVNCFVQFGSYSNLGLNIT
ncbi:hypothetical protein Tco_0281670 [Tanacetum coccineum]